MQKKYSSFTDFTNFKFGEQVICSTTGIKGYVQNVYHEKGLGAFVAVLGEDGKVYTGPESIWMYH